jgi:hypothetical protein
MKRLTAALLLLFSLAGSFLPLAQAATLASNHACCLRKTAHQQCHGSGPSTQFSFSAANCCSHDCCKAVTISQAANPQPGVVAYFAQTQRVRVTDAHLPIPADNRSESQSTRAPPSFLC